MGIETEIIKKITCDKCNSSIRKEEKAFGGKAKVDHLLGYIQAQSDRWEELISLTIEHSRPYDVGYIFCTECISKILHEIADNISKTDFKGYEN